LEHDVASPNAASTTSPILARTRRGLDLRANSLLITVFGDAFAPRGQSIWLGSLIALLGLFDLSPRLVRTSAFRLSADDWFVATRAGRRSYYGLSDVGLLRVQHADQRIYEFNLPQWDGHWTLVLLDAGMRASDRQHLQRELLWESFGRLSSHVFAHPHVNLRALSEITRTVGVHDQVAVLRAEKLPAWPGAPLQNILHATFDLTRVSAAWTQFITRFAPLEGDLDELEPAQAFMARTLLIHEYRRVLLRDPNLPRAFLPKAWPGVRARQLCETLYSGLLQASEGFLLEQVQTEDGPLQRTPKSIMRRGLRAQSAPA
jgi:phenylacetic acid degradation operon negative regulatory protein